MWFCFCSFVRLGQQKLHRSIFNNMSSSVTTYQREGVSTSNVKSRLSYGPTNLIAVLLRQHDVH